VTSPAQLAPYARADRLGLPRKVALAAEILVVHARVRRTVRRNDIRSAVRLLRGSAPAAGGGMDTYAAGVRLGKAVTRVLGPPLDAGCLRMSLVLCAMLARRGVGSSVVIGVKGGSDFGAHAWVELAGRPILPASETEFERLVAL
jgi:hypothetical protein